MPRKSMKSTKNDDAIDAQYTEKGRKSYTPLTTEEWQEKFCYEFARCGSLTKSADRATVERTTVYRSMNNDPSFKARVEQARKEYAELIIATVSERAIDGVEEVEITTTVDQETGLIMMREKRTIRRSDTLLALQAKSWIPSLYGDRLTVNTVNVDAEIERMAAAEAVPADIVRLEIKRMARAELERQKDAGLLPDQTDRRR